MNEEINPELVAKLIGDERVTDSVPVVLRFPVPVLETCRQCRDELPYLSKLPAAVFIVWGRYFPEGAYGPKCLDHAREWFDVSRADQYAVFDLRGLIRAGEPV